MGMFEDAIRNSFAVAEKRRDFERNQEALNARKEESVLQRVEKEKETLLSNPNLLDSRAAAVVENNLQVSTARPKYNKFATKTDAVDAGIPENHPLSGVSNKIKNNYVSMLSDPQYRGVPAATILNEANRTAVTRDMREGAYKYKAQADSSIGNMFGLFGEDKSLAKPKGYDEWKATQLKTQASKVDKENPGMGVGESFAVGAGLHAGLALGGAALTAAGVMSTAPISVPALIGGSLISGALAIPAFFAAHKASEGFEKSEFGTFQEGTAQKSLVGAGLGAAEMALMGPRSLATKGKAVLSLALPAAGAAVGAVSPSLAIDMAGWLGAETLAKKGGAALLNKAITAGKVDIWAEDNLMTKILRGDNTANEVIEKARTSQAKAAMENVQSLQSHTATTKQMLEGLSDAEKLAEQSKAQLIAEDMLTGEVRSGYNTVALPVVQMNKKGKLVEVVDTVGRGKNKKKVPRIAEVADIGIEEIELERKAMGFRNFMEDTAKALEEEELRRAGVRGAEAASLVSEGRIRKEMRDLLKADAEGGFESLYSETVYPHETSTMINGLTPDNIVKVLEEKSSRPISARVLQAHQEQVAREALMAEEEAASQPARRLKELNGKLFGVIERGSKDSAQSTIDNFGKVVKESANGYGRAGEVDVNLLHQDLNSLGYSSLQDYAISQFEKRFTGGKKTAGRFLKNQEDVRKAFGMGGVGSKVAVAAGLGVGLSAMGMVSPTESEAGIITDLSKVGKSLTGVDTMTGSKKIWGNFMQKFTPEVANEIIAKTGVKTQGLFREAVDKTIYGTKAVEDTASMLKPELRDAFKSSLEKAREGAYGSNKTAIIENLKRTYEKVATEPVTLSELRNLLIDDHHASVGGIISWENEKKLLNKAGIDTDHLIMNHGTAGAHEKPLYETSAHDNLLGPGVYTTSGVIRDGVEDITAGYSRAAEGNNFLVASTSGRALENTTAANSRQLVISPKKVFDADAIWTEDKLFREFPEVFNPKDGLPNAPTDSGWNIHDQISRRLDKLRTVTVDAKLQELADTDIIPKLQEYAKRNTPFTPEFNEVIEKLSDVKLNGFNKWYHKAERLMKDNFTTLGKEVERKFAAEIDIIYSYGRKKLTNDYLKSKGYDAITHVGGASKDGHRVMIALDDSIVSPFLPVQPALVERYGMEGAFTAKIGVDAAEETLDKVGLLGTKGDGYFAESALMDASRYYSGAASRETIVNMSPSDFLKIADRGVDQQKLERTRGLVASNTPFSDLPQLMFDHDGQGIARTVGHEGRHRAMALMEKGVTEMPVRFLSREGGEGKAIRWGQRKTPGSYSYIPDEEMPKTLVGEGNNSGLNIPFPKSIFYGLGTAMVGLGALLSPNDASAASAKPILDAAKLSLPESSANWLKGMFGGEGIGKMVKKVVDSGLGFKEMPEGSLSARGFRANYLNTAPMDKEQLDMIIRSTEQVVPGQALSTPYFSGNTLTQTITKMADRFFGNAAVQLGHGQSVVADNVRKSLTIVNDILKTYVPSALKEDGLKIAELMKPAQLEYEAASAPLRAMEITLSENKKMIQSIEKSIASEKNAETKALLQSGLETRKEAVSAIEKEMAGMADAEKVAFNNLTIAQRDAAQKYSRSRIALAVEDTADYVKYPFLRGMLSNEELAAVRMYKDLALEHKERIVNIMGRDAAISEPYIKHSRVVTPEQEKVWADLEERLSRYGLNGKEVVAMTKLHSRTKYSQQMIPDVMRNFGEYIPDVEKRLMNADFWKVGKPGGWDMVRQSQVVQNSTALKAYFDRLAESAKPIEETNLRKLSSGYANLEAARLLLGLPSAPFKHLFKVLGDMSQLGVSNVAQNIPAAMGVAARNYVRFAGEGLAERGLVSKEVASKLFKNSKDVDSFVAGVINQRNMMDYMTDIERTYSVDKTLGEKILQGINTTTSVGIKVIESFDRSLTVLTAMRMAEKQGMTAQQAMYATMDSILKNNFLSGQLNSAWAKDPNVRALFLFQNTPFKIWEKRIMNALIAKQDLVTTWGRIKQQDLPEAHKELKGIGKLMKQAEYAFKEGVIRDGLTASKDPFGTPVSQQFIKEALIVGTVLGGGAMAGVNLTPHTLHTPFFKNDMGKAGLSVSPITQAGFQTIAGNAPPQEKDEWDSEDYHFPIATFFKHWYGTSGYSLAMSKFERISKNDIPEIYKGSKFKFLFSAPGVVE